MSQNFDIVLSLCFIVCRRWKLENKYKKSQKLPFFCHKIKTRTSTKILKHVTLDQNVLYTQSKFGICM